MSCVRRLLCVVDDVLLYGCCLLCFVFSLWCVCCCLLLLGVIIYVWSDVCWLLMFCVVCCLLVVDCCFIVGVC